MNETYTTLILGLSLGFNIIFFYMMYIGVKEQQKQKHKIKISKVK